MTLLLLYYYIVKFYSFLSCAIAIVGGPGRSIGLWFEGKYEIYNFITLHAV